MSDISRILIAIFWMVMPWVFCTLGKQAAEDEIKATVIETRLKILKKFLKENKNEIDFN